MANNSNSKKDSTKNMLGVLLGSAKNTSVTLSKDNDTETAPVSAASQSNTNSPSTMPNILEKCLTRNDRQDLTPNK